VIDAADTSALSISAITSSGGVASPAVDARAGLAQSVYCDRLLHFGEEGVVLQVRRAGHEIIVVDYMVYIADLSGAAKCAWCC
jgi:hypothetical protein